MEVKVKRLHSRAILPTYAKEGDAGLDISAIDDGTESDYGKFLEYRTGLAFEIPVGFVGLMFPRSSISNYALTLSNCVGVIDSGYRGEVTFRFKQAPGARKTYVAGDRIGQLIILNYPTITPCWADDLGVSKRGEGGYGSSD